MPGYCVGGCASHCLANPLFLQHCKSRYDDRLLAQFAQETEETTTFKGRAGRLERWMEQSRLA